MHGNARFIQNAKNATITSYDFLTQCFYSIYLSSSYGSQGATQTQTKQRW